MDRKTIDTYNRSAEAYDEETVDFWERFPRTFLDTFIESSGPNILDVGSGPGRDGLLLQIAGKRVTCVDASEEMVKMSRERGLETVQADFNGLPFPDQSFDGVWSYTALLHVPKLQVDTPLQEIHRVLVPGGVFALGLIEGDEEMYRERAGVSQPRWFSYYQKDELEAKVRQHGFTTLYFETFRPRSKNYLNFIFQKR